MGAKKLSDTDLSVALHKAIASEPSNIAASIACLIEITARDLHTRLGAASLFVYLTRDLKLSESSASKRCAVVRAIRKYPQILDLIQFGRLHLSNISMISRHLTCDNSEWLISLAQTQTQRGLEKTLALKFPQPAKRDTIRPVVYSLQRDQSPVDDLKNLQKNHLPNLTQRVLGARVHVTLNPEAAADLEFLAQAMPGKSPSRHSSSGPTQRPSGSPSGSPSESKVTGVISGDSATNPVARRCDAIHQLEFDHVIPLAFGGQNTLANLRLFCRAHNNLAAKDLMGKEFIESHFGHG